MFPVNSLFGGAIYGKPITLTAQNALITDGQNLWAGSYTIIPASTTNPIVQLHPGNYLLTVPGVVRATRLTVPASTNLQNAASLITSGPLFYFGTNGMANLLPGANVTFITNADGSLTVSAGATGSVSLLPGANIAFATNGNGSLTISAASGGVTNIYNQATWSNGAAMFNFGWPDDAMNWPNGNEFVGQSGGYYFLNYPEGNVPLAAYVPGVGEQLYYPNGSLLADNNGILYGSASGLSNLAVTGIAATGTPGSSTYLRGDGTWSTPAGSSKGGINFSSALPTNSAIFIFGESYAMGYPINTLGVGNNAVGYTGPGRCWPQWLSLIETNIPVYDWAIGGQSSAGALSTMQQAPLGATLYTNGAVCGSYSSITALPGTLATNLIASGGTAYFIFSHEGINDIDSGIGVTTFAANMTNLYATARSYGVRVKVMGMTSAATSITAAHGGLVGLTPYNDWTRGELYATNGLDYLMDASATFHNIFNTNWYFTDNTHLNSEGYHVYATMVADAFYRGGVNATVPSSPSMQDSAVFNGSVTISNGLTIYGGDVGFSGGAGHFYCYNDGGANKMGVFAAPGNILQLFTYDAAGSTVQRGVWTNGAFAAWCSLSGSGETYGGSVTATNGYISPQPAAAGFNWSAIPVYSTTATNYWTGTWTNGTYCAIWSNTASSYVIKQLAP
jgi:lysophospholipase L1-like esterase